MKSKTISIFIIAILIAMISVTSAASVNLVHKDSNWNEIDSAGLLNYTIPCTAELMTYTFTVVESNNMLPNTPYSLVFYSRTDAGTWNPDTVWTNQDTSLIDSGTTDVNGDLVLSGTFDFSLHGQGLENINDGKDYDGSVNGAKVWLVPSADYDGSSTITGWHPTNFLWETELVTCTDSNTQIAVEVVVSCSVGFGITPTNYDYGTLYPGACSVKNPDNEQKVTLSNTGYPDLQVETYTTGIFENIDYDVDGDGSLVWVDANDFSVIVGGGVSKDLNTRICIPSGTVPDSYAGTVTFEYIAVSP